MSDFWKGNVKCEVSSTLSLLTVFNWANFYTKQHNNVLAKDLRLLTLWENIYEPTEIRQGWNSPGISNRILLDLWQAEQRDGHGKWWLKCVSMSPISTFKCCVWFWKKQICKIDNRSLVAKIGNAERVEN